MRRIGSRRPNAIAILGYSGGFEPQRTVLAEYGEHVIHDAPEMAPYARHVFICTGSYCDPLGKAERLYNLFGKILGELGEYDNPVRVKRGVTPCLGVCYNGPLLVVYPDGIWYHSVDEVLLRRIVDEHLRAGRPVEEYIFHRLDALRDASTP